MTAGTIYQKGNTTGISSHVMAVLPREENPIVATLIFNKNIETLVHAKYSDRWVHYLG